MQHTMSQNCDITFSLIMYGQVNSSNSTNRFDKFISIDIKQTIVLLLCAWCNDIHYHRHASEQVLQTILINRFQIPAAKIVNIFYTFPVDSLNRPLYLANDYRNQFPIDLDDVLYIDSLRHKHVYLCASKNKDIKLK